MSYLETNNVKKHENKLSLNLDACENVLPYKVHL